MATVKKLLSAQSFLGLSKAQKEQYLKMTESQRKKIFQEMKEKAKKAQQKRNEEVLRARILKVLTENKDEDLTDVKINEIKNKVVDLLKGAGVVSGKDLRKYRSIDDESEYNK